MFDIEIVTPDLRHNFEDELGEMFKQRYCSFVELLGWDLPDVDHRNKLEIDQFDHPDAIYILVMRGKMLVGHMRLISTLHPHLMSDVFPALCAQGVPRGQQIWEISRACVKNTEPHEVRRRALEYVTIASLEAILVLGGNLMTFQISARERSRAWRRGLILEELGKAAPYGGDPVLAVMSEVNHDRIDHARQTVGITGIVHKELNNLSTQGSIDSKRRAGHVL